MTLRFGRSQPLAAPRPRAVRGYGPLPRLLGGLLSVSGQLIALVCAILIWQICWFTEILPRNSFPSVPQVADALFGQLQTSVLWTAAWHTVQGWAIGLLIASAAAILLATVMGSSVIAYKSVMPIVEFVKTVPAIAILPLAVLMFGPTREMKLCIIFWGVFWAFTIQTVYGLRSIDPVQRDNARVLGLRGLRLFRVLTLPSLSPYLATGFRIGAAVALIEAIVAELIGGAPGLGYLIVLAMNAGPSALPRMYAFIFMTGLLGIIVTGIFTLMERRLLHWHESQRVQMKEM